MTDKEYYSDTEYKTNTMLGWAAVGPRYFQKQMALVGQEEEDVPDYYVFGTAVHCYLLENKEFAKRYVVLTDKGPSNATQKKFCELIISHDKVNDKALTTAYTLAYSTEKMKAEDILKKAKELYKKYSTYIQIMSSKGEKQLLSNYDYERIQNIAYNIKAHERAAHLLYSYSGTESHNEFVIKFELKKDSKDDPCYKFKSKLDRFIIDIKQKRIILVDVKTHSVKFENTNFLKSFSKAFSYLNYDRQFHTYSLALYDYFKKNYPDEDLSDYSFEHKIVAIKSNYDNEVRVFSIPEEYNLSGADKFKEAWEAMRYYVLYPDSNIPYEANDFLEEKLIYEK